MATAIVPPDVAYPAVGQGIAVDILTGWWSGVSVADGEKASDGAARKRTVAVRWQDLVTKDATASVPVEMDPELVGTLEGYGRAEGGRSVSIGSDTATLRQQGGPVEASLGLAGMGDEGTPQVEDGAAAALLGVKLEPSEAVEDDGKDYPRAVERKLRGWEAIAAEAARMRVVRESLGHPTLEGNLRLEFEVHVSAGDWWMPWAPSFRTWGSFARSMLRSPACRCSCVSWLRSGIPLEGFQMVPSVAATLLRGWSHRGDWFKVRVTVSRRPRRAHPVTVVTSSTWDRRTGGALGHGGAGAHVPVARGNAQRGHVRGAVGSGDVRDDCAVSLDERGRSRAERGSEADPDDVGHPPGPGPRRLAGPGHGRLPVRDHCRLRIIRNSFRAAGRPPGRVVRL